MAKGTNFLVLDNQSWPTGEKSGFYILHGKGVSTTVEDPTETKAVECHGSGFWSQDGSSAEGICLNGTGADMYISSFKRETNQTSGQWKIISGTGTGKYAGISGEGSYTASQVPGGRLISNWEGEITRAQ
jgi:hypothetical protein